MSSAYETDRADFLAAFDVSRETLARLDGVIATLDVWRTRTNLIGPKEWDCIWTRHAGDCYQLLAHIPDGARVVDLGSGAGFPGLVIAAARPDTHVTMIESVGKKCAFLRAAIDAASLDASVHHGRVEAAPVTHADVVTARAFAPLDALLDYASPWLLTGAAGVFPKGAQWKEELTAAQKRWILAPEAIPSRSGGAGTILIVRELVRRHG